MTEAERLDAGATVAVSLAATRSMRDGRPVNVELGRPETLQRKAGFRLRREPVRGET
jgi:hypothetical protein